jgi:hypothetical protein
MKPPLTDVIGLNRNHPLAQRLVGAWYYLAAGGRRVINLARPGFLDAAMEGTASFSTGLYGPAMKLTGSTAGRAQTADVPTGDPLQLLAAASILCRYRLDSSTAVQSRVIDKSDGAGGGNGWTIYHRNNDYDRILQVGRDGANPFARWPSNSLPPLGTWVTLLITWPDSDDGSNVRAYVNGVSLGPPPNSRVRAGADAAVPIRFADYYAETKSWTGLYDCTLIWDRQLSASEALAISRDPYQVIRELPGVYVVGSGEAPPSVVSSPYYLIGSETGV